MNIIEATHLFNNINECKLEIHVPSLTFSYQVGLENCRYWAGALRYAFQQLENVLTDLEQLIVVIRLSVWLVTENNKRNMLGLTDVHACLHETMDKIFNNYKLMLCKKTQPLNRKLMFHLKLSLLDILSNQKLISYTIIMPHARVQTLSGT